MGLLKNSKDCDNLKMPESRTKELEAMGLWDISIEEFDDIDEGHEFSERYKRRKRRLLTGLKQIERQKEEDRGSAPQRAKAKGWSYQIAVAAVAAVLLIPSTVFAATKLYELRISRKQHEVEVDIKLQNGTAKELDAEETHILREDGITDIAYRSPMKVTLAYVPKDCIYYEDYKYDGADMKGTYGISMLMLLGDSSTDCAAKVRYSIASEKREVNGQEYVVVTKDETFIYNKEVFIPLKEWNAVLMMYVGEGISISELDKVVAGMQVEETADMKEAIPSDDIEDSYVWDNEIGDASVTNVDMTLKNFEICHIGDTVEQGALDITVDKVETFDSIQGFDRENFYTDMLPEYVNEDGTFAEYNRALLIPGDGITSVNRFDERMKMRQKFVYITLTLKTGGAGVSEYYINHLRSRFLTKDEEENYLSDSRTFFNMDEKILSNFDELMYFDHSAEGNKSKGFFNMGDIPTNSEITVHVGFFADEDLLNEMYLEIPNSRYGMAEVNGEPIGKGYYFKIQE